MKHKLLLSQAILAIALVFLTCAASFGQCTITITDDQPYIEDFEGDGFDCWTVEIDICISEVIDISPGKLDASCASSSPEFLMRYSEYKLNKQGDNIQP